MERLRFPLRTGRRHRRFGKKFARKPQKRKTFSEDFMNKRTHSLWLLITLALLGVILSGAQLNAQQPAMQPDQQSPSQPTAQQPAQQTEQQPGQAPAQPEQQAPDSQAQTQQTEAQTFTGTIMKSDDKYVLKDSDSGTMYDIDRQDLVKTHEGKRVRIQGTLDSDGKTIHVK